MYHLSVGSDQVCVFLIEGVSVVVLRCICEQKNNTCYQAAKYVCACPDICPLAFVLVKAKSRCHTAEGTQDYIESMGMLSLTYLEAVFSN